MSKTAINKSALTDLLVDLYTSNQNCNASFLAGFLSYLQSSDTLYWKIMHLHINLLLLEATLVAKVLNPILKLYDYEISDTSLKEALSDCSQHGANTILIEITKVPEGGLDSWVKDYLLQRQEL